MLTKWLKSTKSNNSTYTKFALLEIEEITSPSTKVKDYLKGCYITSRFDTAFLASMADHIGWNNVKEMIDNQLPTTLTIKRGDFGELLTNTILEQFENYMIPVPKLRFKITGNQSLPGTDTLALKLDDEDNIAEVCYVESKLRTKIDNSVAITAHDQLNDDYKMKLPEILLFTAQRLYEKEDILYQPFANYIGDRKDTTGTDTFRIGLCNESVNWRSTVLDNLQDLETVLSQLSVHIVIIKDLQILTDQIFADLRVTKVLDHD